MSLFQGPGGLEFQEHLTFYQNVGAEIPDLHSSEPNRNRNLSLCRKTSSSQCDQHGVLVYRFQKAISEFVVDIEEDADNLIG